MSRPSAPPFDWDKAIANLHAMFAAMDRKDRNERDRARKQAKRAQS